MHIATVNITVVMHIGIRCAIVPAATEHSRATGLEQSIVHIATINIRVVRHIGIRCHGTNLIKFDGSPGRMGVLRVVVR